MSKRMNKAAKIEQEKAALRRRITDMAYGAMGWFNTPEWDNEDEFVGMHNEMGIETFAKWVGSIERALVPDDKKWLTGRDELAHFEMLSKAVDHLYDNGIRA